MRDNAQLSLHRDITVRVDKVGRELQPVLVVDNFLADALSLVDFCSSYANFNNADFFYPGLRMPAPKAYPKLVYFALGKLMHSVFGISPEQIQGGRADFSMVITPPEHLQDVQCRPHFDSLNPLNLACVHYLCHEEMGGTSLYRHIQTGFECLNPERQPIYHQVLNQEYNNTILTKQYMRGSNEFFAQIASYEARFNRLIMYRGACLHSGNIPEDFSFNSDPRAGRLTLNTFFDCATPTTSQI